MAKNVFNDLSKIKDEMNDILKRLQQSQQGGDSNGQGGPGGDPGSSGQTPPNGHGGKPINQPGGGKGPGQGPGGQPGGNGGNNGNGQGGPGSGSGNGPRDVDDMLNQMGNTGHKIQKVRDNLCKQANTMNINGTDIDTSKTNTTDVKINEEDQNKSAQTVENQLGTIIKRAMDAQQVGDGSCSGLRDLLIRMSKNYVNWLQFLKQFLKKDNHKDKTYLKSHNTRVFRMTGGNGPIMRGDRKKKEKLRGLLIAVDTSGSISDSKLTQFRSDVVSLLKEYTNIQGEVIYWGSDIATQGKFKNALDFENVPVGDGGGTDIKVVFEYAAKNPDIKHIVVYTDGEFYDNDLEDIKQKYYNKWKPVIWVLRTENDYDNFNAPFGYKCL